MRVVSADRLRAFIGPEDGKKISGRKLAKRVGVHPSFIDHLLAGRSRSCSKDVAVDIAEVLEVPLEIIFDPTTPSTAMRPAKRKGEVA